MTKSLYEDKSNSLFKKVDSMVKISLNYETEVIESKDNTMNITKEVYQRPQTTLDRLKTLPGSVSVKDLEIKRVYNDLKIDNEKRLENAEFFYENENLFKK